MGWLGLRYWARVMLQTKLTLLGMMTPIIMSPGATVQIVQEWLREWLREWLHEWLHE